MINIKEVCFIHLEENNVYAVYINDSLFISDFNRPVALSSDFSVLIYLEHFKSGLDLGKVEYEIESIEIRDPRITDTVCDLQTGCPKNYRDILDAIKKRSK